MGKKSNIKGGNKHKKYAKEKEQVIKLNLYELDKDDSQEFAFVLRNLGNKRFELQCYDKKKRIGLVRSSKGNMSKRKNWISVNAIVLISKREFTTIDSKCDIIKLYNDEEVRFLIEHKKIHANFVKSGSFRIDNTVHNDFSFISDGNTGTSKEKKIARNYDDVYADMSDDEVDNYKDPKTLNIDDI